MKPLPLIISFYTKNSPYEAVVQGLISSCEKFSLESSIEGMESAGSWELNCAYKPLFILQQLERHKRSVLWVDADAVVRRPPVYVEAFDADCAVRVNSECASDHPSKVMSGTVYINYTAPGIALVKLWASLCLEELADPHRKEEFWDQVALRDAVGSPKHTARVGLLPLAYIKVFDHPLHSVETDPIIEHYQASRLYKKWIK